MLNEYTCDFWQAYLCVREYQGSEELCVLEMPDGFFWKVKF